MKPNRDRANRLRVAYIVSMRKGLHSFVFREIRELMLLGIEVHLLPTKVGSGPYLPPSNWPLHTYDLITFLGSHARMVVRNPARYLQVLTEAIRYGALLDLALAGMFADVVLSNDLEVIHCHFGDHKFFSGYLCARLAQRPLSVTIHAYELYANPNPRLFARALRRTQAIVTISDYNKSVLVRGYGIPSEQVHVIRLFADLPEYPGTTHEPENRSIILEVARLVEKKGYQTLLRALSLLPAKFEAWIVGDGPLDVTSLSRELGVERRVRVLGRLTDEELQAAYRSAMVFCLPSRVAKTGDREGIPVALIEAMAHGLPVVTTRHAGIPELVEDTIVEEDDAPAIAEAILRLSRDPNLRERQGQRNREIVSSRYSRSNVLLLKALFERMISRAESGMHNRRGEPIAGHTAGQEQNEEAPG